MSEVKLETATKEQLLAAAEKLGMTVDGRWGLETLREEVGKEMEAKKEAEQRAAANAQRLADEAAAEAAKTAPATSSMPNLAEQAAADQAAAEAEAAAANVVPADETPGQRRLRLRNEATKLVRINISAMDPAKNKHKGELISVGNKNIGQIQRFVPFNRDWHVEQVILDALLDKEYMVFDSEKTPRAGIEVKTPRNVKAFNVRVLPPLTEQELKDLAQRQAMADGTRA